MRFVRAAAAVAAFIAIISTQLFAANDVTMARYDALQSSFTTDSPTLPLSIKWEYVSAPNQNNQAAPLIANGKVYFASGDRLYCVDMDTGALKWKYPVEQGLAGNIKATPAIFKNRIYFGATDENVYCLNAETGSFLWAYRTRGAVRCPPVVSDDILYFGADDDTLYAIDPTSGDQMWTKPFVASDDISNGIAVGSGMVVATCLDGMMYGVRANNGKVGWMYRMPDAPVRSSPVIAGNNVVIAAGNLMYAVSVKSGQARWSVTLPAEVAATPATDGTVYYVPCKDKKVYCYSTKGRVMAQSWSAPAETIGMPSCSPTIANETLFVPTEQGILSAFSTIDGSVKWRYVFVPSALTKRGAQYTNINASAAVNSAGVYVVTDDGVLHSLTNSAPDNTPPMIYETFPMAGARMSGAPPIVMQAKVYDSGSGVDFSSISMTLDGVPVDYETDYIKALVKYVTPVGQPGKPVRDLANGQHIVKLAVKDYKGNVATQEWSFTADSSLPRPRSAQPAEDTGVKRRNPNRPSSRSQGGDIPTPPGPPSVTTSGPPSPTAGPPPSRDVSEGN